MTPRAFVRFTLLTTASAMSACADAPLRGGFGPDDATVRDAATFDVLRDVVAVETAPSDDAAGCPGDDAAACAGRPLGCAARERCGNGVDDDCDGTLDTNCPCVPGTVQPCGPGAPGQQGVGQCRAGTQRCEGAGEFGRWGACEGAVAPATEVCDGLDNDCDGCADEGLCCRPDATCPGPGDPRVPEGRPFVAYPLRGGDFYALTARAWRWSVLGGPCDRYLSTPTYDLVGADARDATFTPRLSGDYTVTLEVTRHDGTVARCVFVVHVAGPGLRVELCWDTSDSVDLDLYLHRPDDTGDWFSGREGSLSSIALPTSCNAFDCAATLAPKHARADWGYVPSPLSACEGGPRGDDWRALGRCPNPRLDIDNNNGVRSRGLPENINVDAPRDGQRFRVMVENFSGGPAQPMVNVYCGGRLRASGGAPPDTLPDFRGEWGLQRVGTMWRAFDVTVHVDVGGETTGCDIAPLHPPGASSGYHVTMGDPRY